MNLNKAVKNNNITIVKALLEKPEFQRQVNKKNGCRDSPICIAVQNDNKEMVKLLMEHKATLNGEMDPLYTAIDNNSEEMVNFLLKYRDDNGFYSNEAKNESESEITNKGGNEVKNVVKNEVKIKPEVVDIPHVEINTGNKSTIFTVSSPVQKD